MAVTRKLFRPFSKRKRHPGWRTYGTKLDKCSLRARRGLYAVTLCPITIVQPNFGSCLQARRQFACRFATIAGGVNLAGGVLAGLVAGRADIFAAPR